MTVLVIIEIVIGVLLALGIAIAAFRAFIKGKDRRPGLLIVSSSIAVALLIACLVCSGVQMNYNRTLAAEAEIEKLEQEKVEQAAKAAKASEKKTETKKAAEKTKTEPETEKQVTEAERAQARADFLDAYFGKSDKAESDKTDKTDTKKPEVNTSKRYTDYYQIENIDAAVFTIGVPVYSDDDSEEYEEDYPAMDNLMSDSGYEDSYYSEDTEDYSYDYETVEDDSYTAPEDVLADYFGGQDSYYEGDYSGDYYESSEETDYYQDDSYESEDDADPVQDYSGYVDQETEPYTDYSDNSYEEPAYTGEEDYSYEEPAYTEEEPAYTGEEDYSYEEPETEPVVEEEPYVWSGSVISPSNGANYGPLGLETYYNMDMSGVVSIMRSLGYSEEEYPYYVREDGCKMLGGFIMVAADFSQFSRGDIVQCSLGPAIVCDTGMGGWNWLDIATNW